MVTKCHRLENKKGAVTPRAINTFVEYMHHKDSVFCYIIIKKAKKSSFTYHFPLSEQ